MEKQNEIKSGTSKRTENDNLDKPSVKKSKTATAPNLKWLSIYDWLEYRDIDNTEEGGIKHVKTCLLRFLNPKMAVPYPTSLWSRNKREE
ncbi:hypothetical protein Glove_9g370 [Diversispora epigaea]|uniref:Uncharacterized protein n=1 Tax=Diversispora epigaea TaxID=1348612 RepID=A0A397JPT0_9GLOM|nr:hypothetical protein Glove_9g370 [Diversispora epigaea]